ncbi:hypothetical protein C9439_01490 [archaeon SCG-AAA382B04]|nr:hypothetical protein C9439_01490 [archaeon SCG-AAA382B04]
MIKINSSRKLTKDLFQNKLFNLTKSKIPFKEQIKKEIIKYYPLIEGTKETWKDFYDYLENKYPKGSKSSFNNIKGELSLPKDPKEINKEIKKLPQVESIDKIEGVYPKDSNNILLAFVHLSDPIDDGDNCIDDSCSFNVKLELNENIKIPTLLFPKYDSRKNHIKGLRGERVVYSGLISAKEKKIIKDFQFRGTVHDGNNPDFYFTIQQHSNKIEIEVKNWSFDFWKKDIEQDINNRFSQNANEKILISFGIPEDEVKEWLDDDIHHKNIGDPMDSEEDLQKNFEDYTQKIEKYLKNQL